MKRTLATIFATSVDAYHRSVKANNAEWIGKHEDYLCALAKQCLPSGSGFDNGTKIDIDRSTGEKLVFTTAFHHMNEDGCYDGWTEHTVIVTPSLVSGFNVRVTGRDRNQIKDYIAESFHIDLGTEHEEKELHARIMPAPKA